MLDRTMFVEVAATLSIRTSTISLRFWSPDWPFGKPGTATELPQHKTS
jgi:hypothetical protein